MGYGLPVTGYGLRVMGYGLRVTGYELWGVVVYYQSKMLIYAFGRQALLMPRGGMGRTIASASPHAKRYAGFFGDP